MPIPQTIFQIYSQASLHLALRMPAITGDGITIAVIGAGVPKSLQNSLSRACLENSLPEGYQVSKQWYNNLEIVGYTGLNGITDKSSHEANLDVQATRLLPNVKTLYVGVDFTVADPEAAMMDAVKRYVIDRPDVSVLLICTTFLPGVNNAQWESLWTSRPDLIVVSSTGDDGGVPHYPAESPNVIGVGASSLLSDGPNFIYEDVWGGSNHGLSQTFGTNKPDILLPGNPSTGLTVSDIDYPPADYLFSDSTIGGTSLSAAIAAAVMGAVQFRRKQLGMPFLSSIDVLRKLKMLKDRDFLSPQRINPDVGRLVNLLVGASAYKVSLGGAYVGEVGKSPQLSKIGVNSPIAVEVIDDNGDRVLDYAGGVVLLSSDPDASFSTQATAMVPVTRTNPYHFTTADQGVKVFWTRWTVSGVQSVAAVGPLAAGGAYQQVLV